MSKEKTKIYPEIADYVKRCRNKKGWSLDDCAKESGISKTTLGRIENKKTGITDACAVLLSDAFAKGENPILVHPDYLMGKYPYKTIQEEYYDADAKAFITRHKFIDYLKARGYQIEQIDDDDKTYYVVATSERIFSFTQNDLELIETNIFEHIDKVIFGLLGIGTILSIETQAIEKKKNGVTFQHLLKRDPIYGKDEDGNE